MKAYPDHHWHVWKFAQMPHGWWQGLAQAFLAGSPGAVATLREFFHDRLAIEYKISSPEKWAAVELTGRSKLMVSLFGHFDAVLAALYPDLYQPPPPHATEPGTGDSTPRAMLDRTLTDSFDGDFNHLYKIDSYLIRERGGASWLGKFGNSAPLAIISAYPERYFELWKFEVMPKQLWQLIAEAMIGGDVAAETLVRAWLEAHLQPALGHSTLNDWYSVRGRDVVPYEMALKPFGGSLRGLHFCLQRLYPAHHWEGFADSHSSLQTSQLAKGGSLRRYKGPERWSRTKDRREFFEWLAAGENGPLDFSRLYLASVSLFSQLGASTITRSSVNSPASLVMADFPDHAWQVWRFSKLPMNWWHDVVEAYEAGDLLGLSVAGEFLASAKASPGQHSAAIASLGGTEKLAERTSSQPEWPRSAELMKFRVDPTSPQSRREYFDRIRSNSYESLYRTTSVLQGRAVVSLYRGSVPLAVMSELPEHAWRPWGFKYAMTHWWQEVGRLFKKKDPVVERVVGEYFDFLSAKLGLPSLDLLAHHLVKHFKTMSWLAHLSADPLTILKQVFPMHEWRAKSAYRTHRPWRRRFTATTPLSLRDEAKGERGAVYWSSAQNRRTFLDSILPSASSFDHWYPMSMTEIINAGGQGLLRKFQMQATLAITTEYPEHSWMPWRFLKSKGGWWSELSEELARDSPLALASAQNFLEDLAAQNSIVTLDDYYRLSRDQTSPGAWNQLMRLGGLGPLLTRVYPMHNWNLAKFGLSGKIQNYIASLLAQHLFPDEEILQEVHPPKVGLACESDEERSLRLDIVLPNLRLALEYHGRQHYSKAVRSNADMATAQRDKLKRSLLARNGYALVEIPYWWDLSEESLANSIRVSRADLIPAPQGHGRSIPTAPQQD